MNIQVEPIRADRYREILENRKALYRTFNLPPEHQVSVDKCLNLQDIYCTEKTLIPVILYQGEIAILHLMSTPDKVTEQIKKEVRYLRKIERIVEHIDYSSIAYEPNTTSIVLMPLFKIH